MSPDDQNAIAAILEPFRPSVVYLFGSMATNRSHPGSDIDIAILPGMNLDPMRCFEAAGQLADHLKKHVDLLDLSRCSTVVAKEVIRSGIPLSVSDLRAKQEFEMRALSDYARLNEERHAMLPR